MKKKTIARVLRVLVMAPLSASLLTVPAFADDPTPESKTYQLESQKKMIWYEYQGDRDYVLSEEKVDFLSEDTVWGDEVSYDFRGMGGLYFTASGGITMTLDDDGNFEITFHNPKSYFSMWEIEYESFAITGQFEEKSGNGGYHGGWCYTNEDGNQRSYACWEAKYTTDRCDLISGPTDADWSMDLSKSLASVSTWIDDDGQVSIDIDLSIYDRGAYRDDLVTKHLFTVVGENVGNSSTNQSTDQSTNQSTNQPIDTPAAESEGGDSGITIPAIIIPGTLAAVAVVVVAVGIVRRRKK